MWCLKGLIKRWVWCLMIKILIFICVCFVTKSVEIRRTSSFSIWRRVILNIFVIGFFLVSLLLMGKRLIRCCLRW